MADILFIELREQHQSQISTIKLNVFIDLHEKSNFLS